KGDAAHERLLRAQLVEAQVLDDADTLVRLGVEIGLPEEETRRVVAGDDYAQQVRDDFAAARTLGVRGVPFFALNRAFAVSVSGAQPVETFVSALRAAYTRARPAPS